MFRLDLAARVDRGVARSTNEDMARVVPRLGLALVADGLGGHAHGARASRTAVEACEESLTGGLGEEGLQGRELVGRLEVAFEKPIGESPTSQRPGRS